MGVRLVGSASIDMLSNIDRSLQPASVEQRDLDAAAKKWVVVWSWVFEQLSTPAEMPQLNSLVTLARARFNLAALDGDQDAAPQHASESGTGADGNNVPSEGEGADVSWQPNAVYRLSGLLSHTTAPPTSLSDAGNTPATTNVSVSVAALSLPLNNML